MKNVWFVRGPFFKGSVIRMETKLAFRGSFLKTSSCTLKVEEADCFETLMMFCQNTWRDISKDNNLHILHGENLISHKGKDDFDIARVW